MECSDTTALSSYVLVNDTLLVNESSPTEENGALYQSSAGNTNIDRSIDTMLRSILLLFVSRKPAIQGVFPQGVFKILCIAGFFCVMELLRYSRLEGQFEYPKRKNKIVL